MRESSDARNQQKLLASIESRMGRMMMKLAKPITCKILNHLFVQVGEHGIVYGAWVDELPKAQDAIREVHERIREAGRA